MTVLPHYYDTTLSTPPAPPDLSLPPGGRHGRLWVSDEILSDPDRYPACVARFERSGLWPVLIPEDRRFSTRGEDWIDDRGRLTPADGRIDAADPASVLARWWDSSCCGGDCLPPFGREFPGLARRTASRVDPIAEAGNTGFVLAAHGRYRLGLVPAGRPADVPAVLGWTGMAKCTNEVAAISSVLRSWEDRFGATLIVLGFDEVELSVAAPPKSQGRGLAVAAEHRAFSLPSFTGQPGTIREYAAGLVHRRHWRFSWD